MCEDFSAREEEIGDPHTVADLAEKGPHILDAFEKAIADKVGSLNAPNEIADGADRLVGLAGQQRDVLDGLVDAATKNDFAEVRRLVSKKTRSTGSPVRLLANSARTLAAEKTLRPIHRASRIAARNRGVSPLIERAGVALVSQPSRKGLKSAPSLKWRFPAGKAPARGSSSRPSASLPNHKGVQDLLGESVSPSSVKACLRRGCNRSSHSSCTAERAVTGSCRGTA